MQEYSFLNDYSEGAHPSILALMAETNQAQEDGYGNDTLSRQAEELLKEAMHSPGSTVHFVSGGTQANLIVLASLLRPFESVIAAKTAHINVHEAGAVEVTGHKIDAIESADGKLTPDQIRRLAAQYTDEHQVRPRVVFISNSTEVGTVYTKRELEGISRFCRDNALYLYLDGARLGSALMSRASDLALHDLCELTDVFYVGGTKNGALLGEAIVINNPALQPDFRYHMKQRGALLAKGRILGVQFLGLFREGLYFELALHANSMARKLAQGIREQGFGFLAESTTNQLFPIFPNALIGELQKRYGFYVWSELENDLSAARLVTSWATPEDQVDAFVRDLRESVRAR